MLKFPYGISDFHTLMTLNGDTPYGQLSLKIPNLVSRQLYAEQLRERLLPATRPLSVF